MKTVMKLAMPTQGSDKKRLMARIPASELVGRWQDEYSIDVAPYFRDVETVNVLECKDSGIVHFEPRVIGDEALYHALERHDWYYVEDKWEHRLSLHSVRSGARVLEVGCGRGAFLVRAKELGACVAGIELNNASASAASERGIDIAQCDVKAAPKEWLRSFDLVAAFQVVEHVPEPLDFCESLFSLVKPGGALHVAVPNRESFLQYTDTLLDLPPHHASRWNTHALTYLGNKIGAREIRVVRGPLEPIHVDLFLEISRRRLGRLIMNRISVPMARAALNAGARHFISGHSLVGIYRR